MGSDPGKSVLSVVTGGLSGWVDAANSGQDVGGVLKQGFLGMATAGTSGIKTGGGKYGDETAADSLFPSFINDWASDDRTNARKGKDAADQAAKDQLDANKPTLAPDLTDQVIQSARKRSTTGLGRRGTFLTGDTYGS